MWDVGGQDKLRPLWRSYTRATDGIIFVVDSCKDDRLEEAKLELQRFCRTGAPLLVLANKQDLPAAMDADRMEQRLGMRELMASSGGGQWHLQPTCAVTGDGLEEGMAALKDMITRKRKARAAGRDGVKAKAGAASASTSANRKKLQRSHSHVY